MASDDEKKSASDSRFDELSPGELLVRARERAGLTQEQVAKELYMTVSKVRALESDDYRHMGSGTFTRGYLRAYANFVKLDVVQLLDSYDRHTQQHGLIEQVSPQRIESANKPLWQFIVLVLVALSTLWLVSIWFFDNRQQPSYDRPVSVVPSVEPALAMDSVDASSVSTVSVSSSSELLLSSAEVSVSGAQIFAQNSDSSDANQSAINSSASSARSTASATQAAANQLDVITFSFSAECWLEVSDARGDVLVADLKSKGSLMTVQGKAPFDVKLGNAPAASIDLNGDTVSVVPALGTNVLSIKVGAPTRE